MESRKLSIQVMQMVFTTGWCLITCLLIFYAACSVIFLSQFYFVFKSFLNQSLLLLYFKPSRQKRSIIAGVCTWIKSQFKTQDFI